MILSFTKDGKENSEEKMNWHFILLQTIRIIVLALLFVIPAGYCLFKGNFKKGFWFTWIVWSVVIFIYGIFIPGIAILSEKATGEFSEVSGCGFLFGIAAGWMTGLIFASVGVLLHKIFISLFRKNSNLRFRFR